MGKRKRVQTVDRPAKRRKVAKVGGVANKAAITSVTARLRRLMPRDTSAMYIRELARSIMDPWSGSSCIPDGSVNKGCFSLKGAVNVTTGALGTVCGAIFCLDPASLYVLDTGSAVGTLTIAGNFTAAPSALQIYAIFSRYRVVSGGVKAYFSGADANNGGVLCAGLIPGGQLPNALNGLTLNTIIGGATQVAFSNTRRTLTTNWRPEDESDFGFQPFVPAKSTAGAVNGNVPYLFVAGFGMANAGNGTITIEYNMHFEGYYLQSGISAGPINNPPPAVPGWYEKTMNMLRGSVSVAASIATALGQASARQRPMVAYNSSATPMITEMD